MPQTIHHRLHILEAADWKGGVITLLNPDSPYRPWRYAFGEARPGDYAMLALGTDPASVLTMLARVDEGGGLDGAQLATRRSSLDLVDLTTLAMMFDLSGAFDTWRLDDDDAEQMILTLHESRVYGGPFYRWGHSSVVAARNLLQFSGDCHGCDKPIDLSGNDARDRVHVHTVDPLSRPEPHLPIRTGSTPGPRWSYRAGLRASAVDWPAVLCGRCHHRMSDEGFTSFVAFRFAQHPQCPRCGGGRTQRIVYGMPVDPDAWGPWLAMGGCCRRDEQWCCDICEHEWC